MYLEMHILKVLQGKKIEAMLYSEELKGFKYLFVHILKINFKIFPKENVILVCRVLLPHLQVQGWPRQASFLFRHSGFQRAC